MNDYLMDTRHWRIVGAEEFPKVFRALCDLLPPDSIVGLAEGALSSELQAFFDVNAVSLDSAVSGALPRGEFVHAYYLPVEPQRMTVLADTAERHAEPEIARHMIAIGNGVSLLEWYDAPDDPISLSMALREVAVTRFARAVGGSLRVAEGVE